MESTPVVFRGAIHGQPTGYLVNPNGPVYVFKLSGSGYSDDIGMYSYMYICIDDIGIYY